MIAAVIPLSRGMLPARTHRGGWRLCLFLVREDLEAVPLDRVLEPIFLQDPAQLLGYAGDLDGLSPTVQIELDLVRDREDHPHEPLAVVPLGLPVVPQVPKVLLDEHVDALHVLRELLGLLEELQEQRTERGHEVLPLHLLVELDVPAPRPPSFAPKSHALFNGVPARGRPRVVRVSLKPALSMARPCGPPC